MSTTQHPLTEAAAVEMWDASPCPEGYEFRGMLTVEQDATLYAMRAAFDAGREHERANPDDALRAAREQGWDDAAEYIHDHGWPTRAALREANPYRPAQELPPERDGVVLVPADGHGAITTTKGQEFARLTFTTKQDLWYGPNLAARPGDWVIQTTAGDRLTPGTWKLEGE